jgi:hypothetical protein
VSQISNILLSILGFPTIFRYNPTSGLNSAAHAQFSMRGLTLISTAAVIASAFAAPQPFVREEIQKVQRFFGFGDGKKGAYPGQPVDGKLPDKMQFEDPLYFKELGAKRVKVRYGPYHPGGVKSVTWNTLLSGEGGMLDSIHTSDTKPCTDCMVTYIHAGLEFANGTTANTDSGLWLHHVILSLDAPDRHDRVCNWMPKERIFSSGNERMPVDMTNGGSIRAGYPFYPKDKLRVTLELQNQNDAAQEVFLTVTYDFLPFVKQQEFKEVRAMWFDVSNCTISFVPAKATPRFDYTMNSWKSTVDGQLLFVGGHLHDGGVDVLVHQNEKQVCDSTATYGGGKGFITAGGKDAGMEHISNMTTCHNFGRIKKDDVWSITANYDYSRFKGMQNEKGMKDMVMGIAIMYAMVDT